MSLHSALTALGFAPLLPPPNPKGRAYVILCYASHEPVKVIPLAQGCDYPALPDFDYVDSLSSNGFKAYVIDNTWCGESPLIQHLVAVSSNDLTDGLQHVYVVVESDATLYSEGFKLNVSNQRDLNPKQTLSVVGLCMSGAVWLHDVCIEGGIPDNLSLVYLLLGLAVQTSGSNHTGTSVQQDALLVRDVLNPYVVRGFSNNLIPEYHSAHLRTQNKYVGIPVGQDIKSFRQLACHQVSEFPKTDLGVATFQYAGGFYPKFVLNNPDLERTYAYCSNGVMPYGCVDIDVVKALAKANLFHFINKQDFCYAHGTYHVPRSSPLFMQILGHAAHLTYNETSSVTLEVSYKGLTLRAGCLPANPENVESLYNDLKGGLCVTHYDASCLRLIAHDSTKVFDEKSALTYLESLIASGFVGDVMLTDSLAKVTTDMLRHKQGRASLHNLVVAYVDAEGSTLLDVQFKSPNNGEYNSVLNVRLLRKGVSYE